MGEVLDGIKVIKLSNWEQVMRYELVYRERKINLSKFWFYMLIHLLLRLKPLLR